MPQKSAQKNAMFEAPRKARSEFPVALIGSALLVALLLISGCSSEKRTGGYIFNERALAEVEPGKSTPEDVQRLLGTPSSKSEFEVMRWHYIGKTVARKGVLNPDLLTQEIVTIEFDQNGTVKDIQKRSAEDAREMDMVGRTTPTRGHSVSVMEQLIGNFGRFNQPAKDE